MHHRESLSALDNAEHELPSNTTSLFIDAVSPKVTLEPRLTMNGNGRQTIENNGQLLIQKRPHLLGDERLDFIGMVYERIHRTQQVLVGDSLRHIGDGNGLKPI